MADITLNTTVWAFLGGLLPALFWLWFWLKEDSKRPEPKRLIFIAFVAGVVIIPIVLFIEKILFDLLPEGVVLVGAWATVEEVFKYLAAYYVAFRVVCIDGSKCIDEPIDPIIYLITVALGFAAIENALFIIGPLLDGDTISGIVTGNLRFVGATLLHVVASSAIGIAMALSYYKSKIKKRIYVAFGLFTAIFLHILFNLSIINNNGDDIFITFSFLWIAAMILLLFFEKVKKINR